MEALLQSIPPLMVYLLVGAVVGDLGIRPAEIVLVGAAYCRRTQLARPADRHRLVIGAVVGVGCSIGRASYRYFDRLGRRFPKHFGPGMSLLLNSCSTDGVVRRSLHRAAARRTLAGALKMPYPRFLAANITGGCWAGGTCTGLLRRMAAQWIWNGSPGSRWSCGASPAIRPRTLPGTVLRARS